MRNLKKQTIKGLFQVFRSLAIYFHFKKIKKNLLKTTLVLLLLSVNISGTTSISNNSGAAAMNVIEKSAEDIYIESFENRFQTKLKEEVQAYITKMAPESKLTSEYLVSKCLEYDTDIVFVLSQALLESHFGTKGKAAHTNSVWNVGTYDDGQILYTYKHPDESLEPYLKLINEKYLINITSKGDTIYKDLGHLVQDKGYINYNGNRFASARGYENGLRKLMIRIDMETSISFYQDMLSLEKSEILAFFVNPVESEIDYSKLQAMN